MLARALVGVLIVVGCKGKAEDRADDKAASPAVGSGSGSAVAPPAVSRSRRRREVAAAARRRCHPKIQRRGRRIARGTIAYGVVASDATRILVSGTEEDGGYTFMCRKKGDEDGERFECKEKDDEEDAGAACFGPGAERTDIVFDSTGKTLLVVTQDDGPAAAEVTLVPGGVKISGHGCDRIEPLK